MKGYLRYVPKFITRNRFTLLVKYVLDVYVTRKNFFSQGRTVQKTSRGRVGANNRKTFLFPTIYFLDRGFAWQATIAKALEVRGHRVQFMPMDIAFPKRNALYFDEQDAGFATHYYKLYTNRMVRSFGFTDTPYSQWGDASEFPKYRSELEPLDEHACRSYTFDDIPFGRLALNSVIHYFRCGNGRMEKETLDAYKDFIAIGRILYGVLQRALDAIRPDVIFTLNGSFLDSALHIELGKRRGIRVVTFEAGFMLNSMMLGVNENIVSFPMANYLPEEYQSYSLSKEQERKLDEYLRTRSLGKDCIFDYWGKPIFDYKQIRKQLGLREGVQPDILFTNLLWDSALLQSDVAFSSQEEWIVQTIQFYADHPERTLLIRIHPAEVNPPFLESQEKMEDVIRRRVPALPKNVVLIPPTSSISSYPLTEMSNMTLVYASTAGLEAAIMGKPVILVGETHFRRQGFTYDAQSVSEYFELLKKGALPGSKQTVIRSAKKYAFFFFFGFMIPFPLVEERPTNVEGEQVSFTYQSEDDLLPGRYASLDFIIDVLCNRTSYSERLRTLLQ